MAYMVELNSRCEAYGCHSPAKYQVYNNRNSPMGRYCRPHAKRRVDDLQKVEGKSYEP